MWTLCTGVFGVSRSSPRNRRLTKWQIPILNFARGLCGLYMRSIRSRPNLVSLAMSRRWPFPAFAVPPKPNALAWLTGFSAGYYGAPYVWPLGTLDPQFWALGFIEGRGHRGHP